MRTIPLIYESNTTTLESYSLGSLPDTIQGTVTEERNGEFYLSMKYSAFGQNANLIKTGRIISCKPNMYDDVQAFRIATIEKTLDGMMTITAYHISYDLSQTIVMPFSADNITDALNGLVTHGTPVNAFYFGTDKTTVAPFKVTQPTPLRSLLVGMQGSLVDVYGGEYKFDNWGVSLLNSRGTDRNVQIAYGKNLSGFKETDNSGAYDSIVPFAVIDDVLYYITDTTICPTAPVVPTSVSYGYPGTLSVDFSDQFSSDNLPTDTALYNLALSYINRNTTSATANLATEYVDLAKFMGETERVDLCDRVYISVKPFGLNDIQSKVICTVYNILTDTYESVQIGDKKLTLADTLASLTR